MSKSIVSNETATAIHPQTSALSGAKIEEALAERRDLVAEAISNSRYSIKELLFPSERTRQVRDAEHGLVMQHYRTKAETLRSLDEAWLTVLHTGLDAIVQAGCIGVVANAASEISEMAVALRAKLDADWRIFSEGALDQIEWAKDKPPLIRDRTIQMVDRSFDAYMRMTEDSVKRFEALVHQSVGKR